MTSPTRSRPVARPNSPGISAADMAAGDTAPATRAAAKAAREAAEAQRRAAKVAARKTRSAAEINQEARDEAARIAAIPPWYMRKRYLLPTLALGIVAVAASSMIGSAPQPAPPPVVQAVPSIAAPSIGQTVTDGQFSFTLRSVTLPGDIIGETVGAEKAVHSWVVVEVDVTNSARVPRALDATRQELVDSNGKTYPASVVPSLPGWDQAYISGVGAGETATANIAFDVPANLTFTTLRLTDGLGGKGVDLPLR